MPSEMFMKNKFYRILGGARNVNVKVDPVGMLTANRKGKYNAHSCFSSALVVDFEKVFVYRIGQLTELL